MTKLTRAAAAVDEIVPEANHIPAVPAALVVADHTAAAEDCIDYNPAAVASRIPADPAAVVVAEPAVVGDDSRHNTRRRHH